MKTITITTQSQLDKLKRVKRNETVIIDAELRLNDILRVEGHLVVNKRLDCDMWERFIYAYREANIVDYGHSIIRAEEHVSISAHNSDSVWAYNDSMVNAHNATVVARDNTRVQAYDNAFVQAGDSAYVEAHHNSKIVVCDRAIVKAYDNSSVKARDNALVEAYDNAVVEAWNNAWVDAYDDVFVIALQQSRVIANHTTKVQAWDESSVIAYGHSGVEAKNYSCIRTYGHNALALYDYAVAFISPIAKPQITRKSRHIKIHKLPPFDWFQFNGVKKTNKIIVYKQVSKDFTTQEGTCRETLYAIGTTIEHPNWHPESNECSDGKFHACSHPLFTDYFRDNPDDKYIAIEVDKKDLYAWTYNPKYPHKIAFRKGKVLYECDKDGRPLSTP